ncbi:22442_t:CDS:2, partial [Dentiscutata erythropus]
MSNVYTLKDFNKRGHRLGSAYEQKLKKKIRSVTEFNSEINDLSEKLVDKYNEQEKEYQQSYSDIGNKISQLNASSTKVRSQFISEQKSHSESQCELEAKYTAEIKSLKSSIKTLKRETTLAQKASSANKIKILSLETKVRELEGKLEDLKPDLTFHDSDIMGRMIEEPAKINSSDPKEVDSSQKIPENILETLQELLPRDEIVLKNQEVTLSNQSVYSGEEVVPSSQVMPLVGSSKIVPAIPAIESSLMSYANLLYFFLQLYESLGKKSGIHE